MFGPWTSATHLNKTSVAEGIKENGMKRYTNPDIMSRLSSDPSSFPFIYLGLIRVNDVSVFFRHHF